jgi:hypothetical protein
MAGDREIQHLETFLERIVWLGRVCKAEVGVVPPATDVQVRRTPGSGEPYVRAVIKQRAEGEFTSHESAGVRGIVEKGTCFPLEQK